jgi:hypothetical protein
MRDMQQAIRRALDGLSDGPRTLRVRLLQRYRLIVALQAYTPADQQRVVGSLRKSGWSWRRIGEGLGVSRQAVRSRFEDVDRAERLVSRDVPVEHFVQLLPLGVGWLGSVVGEAPFRYKWTLALNESDTERLVETRREPIYDAVRVYGQILGEIAGTVDARGPSGAALVRVRVADVALQMLVQEEFQTMTLMRSEELSWQQIASVIDRSKQHVQQRYARLADRNLAPDPFKVRGEQLMLEVPYKRGPSEREKWISARDRKIRSLVERLNELTAPDRLDGPWNAYVDDLDARLF